MEELRSIVKETCEPDESEALGELEFERAETANPLAEDAERATAAWLGRLFAGRALLGDEALRLIAQQWPAHLAPPADPIAALQRAALRGALRLTAAVAPAPGAQPASRLRGWAERLRRARPYGRAARSRAPGLPPEGGEPNERGTSYSARARMPAPSCRRCGSGGRLLRRTSCAACGSNRCAYCEACLTMGRSRRCGLLVLGVQGGASLASTGASAGQRTSRLADDSGDLQSEAAGRFGRPRSYDVANKSGANAPEQLHRSQTSSLPSLASEAELAARWGLSPAQSCAAAEACRFLLREPSHSRQAIAPGMLLSDFNTAVGERSRSGASGLLDRLRELLRGPGPGRRGEGASPYADVFLLWAVTGAGKTEMLFPLIEAVVARGGRALVATPRRDVVLELAPRLAKAFPDCSRTVLYGGSEMRWENGQLTVATTHQLLRFEQAFDLVVVDEMDAFPYHNNPMLIHAAAKSRKPDGTMLLLSATPPPELQLAVRRRRLAHAKVPVRFHRYPLPVPQRMKFPGISGILKTGTVPQALRRLLNRSLQRGAQVFVFVPYVRQVGPLAAVLRKHAAAWGIAAQAVDGTSSKDPDRGDKVAAFRTGELQVLVTTTILERGVTIPRSDVFILDADSGLFDAAALVQMAGRAGRSIDDPAGSVVLASRHWTAAQRDGIAQITSMNRTARRLGYLRSPAAADPAARKRG